jgi:hypothetical protein
MARQSSTSVVDWARIWTTTISKETAVQRRAGNFDTAVMSKRMAGEAKTRAAARSLRQLHHRLAASSIGCISYIIDWLHHALTHMCTLHRTLSRVTNSC